MQRQNKIARNVYFVLIGLTAFSFLFSEVVPVPILVAIIVVAVGVAKGMLIENYYLGLKIDMNPQRLVFDGWLLLCGLVIIGGYIAMVLLN